MISPVLDYTSRDWSRWDTFDLRRYSYVTRASHGLQDTVLEPPTTQDATYFAMYRQEVMSSIYAPQFQAYKWLQTTPGSTDDYPHQLQKDGTFEPQSIIGKLSYQLNEAYNKYRTVRKADLRYALKLRTGSVNTVGLDNGAANAFDQELVKYTTKPEFQPTIIWLTSLLTLHLDLQTLDPNLVVDRSNPDDWRGPTWKPFGTWIDPVTKTYNQDAYWWIIGDIVFLYGHYLHLLDNTLIRRIRDMAQGVLGAMWAIYLNDTKGAGGSTNMADSQALESQWTLRINGFVGATYILHRSQDELQIRGVWGQDPRDLRYEDVNQVSTRVQNRALGQWSLAEATSQAEAFVDQLATRMTTIGASEFLGDYYLYHQNAFADWLLHAPSQKIYDEALSMWRRTQWDLVINYQPSSNSFPGPSGRSHNLHTGVYTSYDSLDKVLYFKHVFPAAAKPDTLLRVLTNGTQIRANLSIPGQAFFSNTPVKDLAHTFHRELYAMAQLAGEGTLPYDWLVKYVMNAPTHINQARFSDVAGQERYNFMTNQYSLGHSGENLYLRGSMNPLVARVTGEKAVPSEGPFMQSNKGPAAVSTYIQIMSETTDNPFQRPGTLGDAGADIPRFSRQIASQYQGFMLATQMFAPTNDMSNAEISTAPWTTDLILPLSVDSLLLNDGTVLPTTAGSTVAIPNDQLVFTVRHGNAAMVIRLVSYEQSDPSPVIWEVTDSSLSSGAGRIAIRHRKAGSGTAVKPYRLVWLIGSGKFANLTELNNLQQLIGNAVVQQDTQVTGIWDETNQPRDRYPAGSPAAPIGEVGARKWTTTATISSIKLSVERTDVYLPWNNSPIYAVPRKGPLYAPPYYSRDVSRTVNGQDNNVWSLTMDAYRTLIVPDSEIFAPHRPQPAPIGDVWIYFQ